MLSIFFQFRCRPEERLKRERETKNGWKKKKINAWKIEDPV